MNKKIHLFVLLILVLCSCGGNKQEGESASSLSDFVEDKSQDEIVTKDQLITLVENSTELNEQLKSMILAYVDSEDRRE